MGKVANAAVRQRRRRRVDDLARAATVPRRPDLEAERRARLRRTATAELRRAIRIRHRAEETIRTADQRASEAAQSLVDLGLTQAEIAARGGVPLWTIRRLLAAARLTDTAVVDGDN